MNNKKKLLTVALTAVIIMSLVTTAVTSIAVPPENSGDTITPENSAPGEAALFVENPAGEIVGIGEGAVTAFTITPDVGTATEVSEYYTAVVNTTGVSSLTITIPKGFEAVAPTSAGLIAEINVYDATGNHGTLTVTANASEPQTKIDVKAETEGASVTATGIDVDYSPGAENTISGTYKGDYETVVTLKLPDASTEGNLSISVPAELVITNGSIAIGQFVRNPSVGGDYVFTAYAGADDGGVSETVHITSVTSFTITPDTNVATAVSEYTAEVNTTGVSVLTITLPAGFEAVAPTSAGLIAEIDVYNATGTHGTLTVTANVSDPEEDKIDVKAMTEGASVTSRGITVDYSPGAENTITSTYYKDYITGVTLKLPDASADGSLSISVPAELHITNGSISIGQFVRNPPVASIYTFVAAANGETAGKGATVAIEEGDTTAPYTSGHNPAKGASGVSIGTNIVVHVRDDGAGVDQSTIVMTVEGEEVAPAITGSPADYTLTYDPPTNFGYSQVVDVTIDATDLAATPNAMAQDAYSFTTESEPGDTTPPTISITSPTTGQTFTTATITVSGTATDNVGLSKVEVKVNDGSWQLASGTSSWSKSVTLASGSNTIYAKATDTSGNTKETSVTVTYNPPEDITAPTWDTTTGIQSATDTGLGGQVTVTYGTATDVDSPPVKYNVYYNTVSPATDGTKLSNVGLSPYTVTGLTNGQLYYFSVRVEDSATPPNEDTNTVELTATPTAPLDDTTPPILIVTTPLEGQDFAISEITVSGSATDESGIFSVTVNGAPVTVEADGSFSTSVILIEGTNIITVVATDYSENYNTATVTRTVTYTPPLVPDTTPPILIVTTPLDGQEFTIRKVTVSGFASDESGILAVTVNGYPATLMPDDSFSFALTLNPGENTISVVAIDNSENHNTATVTRTVTYTPPVVPDTTPPTLVVIQPREGEIFAINKIAVSGTATDDSGISSVTVNGAPVTVEPDGSFSTSVTLVEGANLITVVATDYSENLNTATITRTVTYTPPVVPDNTPPRLVVNQPRQREVFAINKITVSGTATDDRGIFSVTVNGAAVAVEPDGYFTTPVILAAGTNTVTITATDNSENHNTATVTRTVTYIPPLVPDTTPPTLIVRSPRDGHDSKINKITVRGSATDESGIRSVTVNGAEAKLVGRGGSFSCDVDLVIGENTITVTAIDRSDNLNTDTVTLVVTYTPPVDREAPTLILTQPEEGLNIISVSNIIEVAGTVYDESGINTLTVNGDPVEVTADNLFSASVILTDGVNLITVVATDNSPAQNQMEVTRTVTYSMPVDGPGPPNSISLSANPTSLKADGEDAADITARVTDENGADVADGTEVYFSTTNGSLYPDRGMLNTAGSSTLSAVTSNGVVTVVLVSSALPATATVTSTSGTAENSIDVPFEATATLSSEFGDTTIIITHSPSITVQNCSVSVSGNIMEIYTSTSVAVGIVDGTIISVSVGAGSTLDFTVINPIVTGGHVICEIEKTVLNNPLVESEFPAVSIAGSDVDVELVTTCMLSGMEFVLTQHRNIEDAIQVGGGADAGLVGQDVVLANIVNAVTAEFGSAEYYTGFVITANLEGATGQDIVKVPMNITVGKDWFTNNASSNADNVRLMETNLTTGLVEEVLSVMNYDTSAEQTVTFYFEADDFSTFAIIAQPEAPTPPARGGGGAAPLDSDGDGYSDATELLAGTDPNDPCDPDLECAACLAMRPPAPIPAPPVAPIPTFAVAPIATPTPTPSPTPTPAPAAPLLPPLYLILIVIAAIIAIVSVFFVVQWKKRKKEKKEKEIY